MFLGGENFDLQGILLRANGHDFGHGLLIFVSDLLQDEHDHADGDEKLQHGHHKKTGAVKVFILLGQRVACEVKAPQQKAQRQHARPHKRHFFSQPVKTNPGKNAAQTQQNEHRQLHFEISKLGIQRGGQDQRADEYPDHE